MSAAQVKAYEELAQYFGAIARNLMITSGDVKDTARLAFHFARLAGR